MPSLDDDATIRMLKRVDLECTIRNNVLSASTLP